MEVRINLASGQHPKDGWINVDISPEAKPDKIMDLLQFPWPWPDSSVDELHSSHFLEHVGDEFIPFMDECYRILKPGGNLTVQGPYYTSIRCWQDPTHKRALSETLFRYFDKSFRKENGISHYSIKSDFVMKRVEFLCGPEVEELAKDREQFEWLRLHAWNIVQDLNVTLEARK